MLMLCPGEADARRPSDGGYANIHMSSVPEDAEQFPSAKSQNRPISAQEASSNDSRGALIAQLNNAAAGPRPNSMPAHMQMMYQSQGRSFNESIDPELRQSLQHAEKMMANTPLPVAGQSKITNYFKQRKPVEKLAPLHQQ